MDQIFLIGLIASALRLGTPILFAALGEAVSQRSGVLNVGIDQLVGSVATDVLQHSDVPVFIIPIPRA